MEEFDPDIVLPGPDGAAGVPGGAFNAEVDMSDVSAVV